MAEAIKVQTPRNASQAAELLRRIGEAEAVIGAIGAKLDIKIGRLTAKARELADPRKDELAKLDEALLAWAGAHREELLEPGKKSVSLATGEIGWRKGSTKVELPDDKDELAKVIAAIRRRELGKLFLRESVTVDKAAMLKRRDDAARIPGVRIVTAPESFWRKPLALDVAKAA